MSNLLVKSLKQRFMRYTSTNFSRFISTNSTPYDALVVGGGITGTSLLYTLSAFTDLKKIGLCERRDQICQVASHGHNNSQTIHAGDIETNYTLEKATAVKTNADVLRNYACGLPPAERDICIYKMSKMALAVGDTECAFMEERYKTFKPVFKNMQLIGKKQIADVEPCVAMPNSHTFRPEEINAIYIDNEHTAVDYQNLGESFLTQATLHAEQNKSQVDIRMKTSVDHIEMGANNLFKVTTSNGILYSKYVVVSSCGHSLLIAHRMGYGLNYSCLPVAGSFYFGKQTLNGKVYTVQDPRLPFAAIHGDPDVVSKGTTRFGPTAIPLPLLERYNSHTMKDFFEVLKPNLDLAAVFVDLLKSSAIRNYLLKNFLLEVPFIKTKLFLQDVQKIIPSMRETDLKYANGFGGVRPQLVDKKAKKLILGEGRILPEDDTPIVFNITPSPGGTTCLGTAEIDAKRICRILGFSFDEKNFEKVLKNGPYIVA